MFFKLGCIKMSSEKITLLKGYSGCKILLVEAPEKSFIRKISSDCAYNERLLKQCRKQSLCGFGKTPRVFGSGYVDGLFFFDMQYVRGGTLSEYLLQVPATYLKATVEKIYNAASHGYSVGGNGGVCAETQTAIRKKIESLRSLQNTHANLAEVFEYLDSLSWSGIRAGDCHGDMTLENVIVDSAGEFYMIDFLDSFVESPVVDIAKTLQDIFLRWSYRYRNLSVYEDIRLSDACDVFLGLLGRDAALKKAVFDILLVNLLRIYPYIKDEKTRLFLDAATKKTLNFIL